jgi:hypothetical protein
VDSTTRSTVPTICSFCWRSFSARRCGCPPLGLDRRRAASLRRVAHVASDWIIDRLGVASTPFTTVEQFAVSHLDLIGATPALAAIGGWMMASQHVNIGRSGHPAAER